MLAGAQQGCMCERQWPQAAVFLLSCTNQPLIAQAANNHLAVASFHFHLEHAHPQWLHKVHDMAACEAPAAPADVELLLMQLALLCCLMAACWAWL